MSRLSSEELAALGAALGATVTEERKSTVISVPPSKVVEACRGVSSLPGLYHLSTITGVDLGDDIALLYHFWRERRFVQVRTTVPKAAPRLQSISGVLPAAVLYEAEIQDLLGVGFEGNPYAGKKLLLPDSYPPDAPPPLRREADPEKIRRIMELE